MLAVEGWQLARHISKEAHGLNPTFSPSSLLGLSFLCALGGTCLSWLTTGEDKASMNEGIRAWDSFSVFLFHACCKNIRSYQNDLFLHVL
jgi:hypothetical protein